MTSSDVVSCHGYDVNIAAEASSNVSCDGSSGSISYPCSFWAVTCVYSMRLFHIQYSPIGKWVSAYELSNNNNGDGECGWYMPIFGRLTAQVDWLGLRVGGHPALSLHSSNEPGELSHWLWSWRQHHKHCRGYYYYYRYFLAHQHKAAGRKTRLDVQNCGCSGNLLWKSNVVSRVYSVINIYCIIHGRLCCRRWASCHRYLLPLAYYNVSQ